LPCPAGTAGAAGAGTAGASNGGGAGGWTRLMTLDIPARLESKVKNREVKAKVPANTAVNFFMKSDPEGVLIRESPPPPNTDKPAPRPVCRSTTMIISAQEETCTTFRNPYKIIVSNYSNIPRAFTRQVRPGRAGPCPPKARDSPLPPWSNGRSGP